MGDKEGDMDRGLLRPTASGWVHHKESELLDTNSRFMRLRRHCLLVELLVSSSGFGEREI